MIWVELREFSVILYRNEKCCFSLSGMNIAFSIQGVTTMNLFRALYKILVWIARSLALIIAVLFLAALQRFRPADRGPG